MIESCQATRDVRAVFLRGHGIDVHTAEGVEQARSLWEADLYAVVLLDVRRYLPGEATRILPTD